MAPSLVITSCITRSAAITASLVNALASSVRDAPGPRTMGLQ
jgi:hypothetical protein